MKFGYNVAACSAVLLVSFVTSECAEAKDGWPTPIFLLNGSQLKLVDLAEPGLITAQEFGIDDVATVVSVASDLGSMFGVFGNKNEIQFRQINEKLDQLRAQNTVIINRLDQIASILNNLDYAIKEAVREQFSFDLRTQLSGYIVQYQEIVQTARADKNYDPDIDLANLYSKIYDLARHIEGYGYVAYPALATAYYYESDIGRRLVKANKLNKSKHQVALGYYEERFLTLRNADLNGTPGNDRKNAKAELSDLEKTLADADGFLKKHGNTFMLQYDVTVITEKDICDNGGGARWIHRDHVQYVNGDKIHGYTISDAWINDRNPGESTCHHSHWLTVAPPGVAVQQAFSNDGDQTGIVNGLNAAITRTNDLKRRIAILDSLDQISQQVLTAIANQKSSLGMH